MVGRGIFFHHPHISRHVISSCGDFLKKGSRAITQEFWKTLSIKINKLLPALINKIFEKLQKKKQ
jgi:hypothetical protein